MTAKVRRVRADCASAARRERRTPRVEAEQIGTGSGGRPASPTEPGS
jgi:hypothetical protein